MTDRIGVSKTGPATSFYLECDRVGQDVGGNYTTLKFRLRNVSGPGATTGSYHNGQGWQRGSVDGHGQFGEHYGNPFLPSGYGNGATRWNDGDWYMNIGHNADGGRGGVTLRMNLQYGSINEDHTAWFDDFPAIPRASQPSFPYGNWFEPGNQPYVAMNRASGSFYHNVYFSFGGISERAIQGGVGDGFNWTVPWDTLDQIPNATSGVGEIIVNTHVSGSNAYLGQKRAAFGINVPASVVPTWTGNPTLAEATPGVASDVGAYVQSISTLSYAIAGAAGAYSSSINTQRMTVAGQTLNGASGTSAPIGSSGTVPVTFLIQDSRGRSKTETRNITVLPYSTPSVSNFTVTRSLSDGTIDLDDGTYLRVELAAAVQSLMNTTQRNLMQYKIYTRLRGTTPWTLKKTVTPGTGKVTWNSLGATPLDPWDVIPGPFDIDKSYDVRVEVVDRYNMSASISTVSVAAIFMHWAPNGLGVNKYWEQGALDVGGDIFMSGQPVFAGPIRALLDPAYIGPGPAKVSFDLSNALSTSAYRWVGEYRPNGNRVVDMIKQGNSWVILGHSKEEGYGGSIRVDFDSTKLATYTAATVNATWVETFTARRLPSGIVQLDGMMNTKGAATVGVIATLPPMYRPDFDLIVPIETGDNRRALTIGANGNISTRASWPTNATYVSFSNIAYPAAGVATWLDIGTNGSAFQNGWVKDANSGQGSNQWGSPAFWKDSYGMVWYRGLIGGGQSTTDNTPMFSLPSNYGNPYIGSNGQTHQIVANQDGFGYVTARTTGGQAVIGWKNGSSGNGWISLGGMHTQTQESLNQPGWVAPVKANNWVDYDITQFPGFNIWRRPDGLIVSRGLVRAGTVPSRMSLLENYQRSGYGRRLLPIVSAAGRGRVDIQGDTINDGGTAGLGEINMSQGSNSWFSFDGVSWILGD